MADINPTQLSPRAAEHFQNIFMPGVKNFYAKIPLTPFSVILFGPGPGTLSLYTKRVQICKELDDMGQAAVLAEKVEELDPAPKLVLPRVRRWVYARNADLVVVLIATPADIANAQDFTVEAAVNAKLLIFVPNVAMDTEYRATLTQLAERYDSVKNFHYPNDVESCQLKAQVLNKLGEMQLAKFRATLESVLQC